MPAPRKVKGMLLYNLLMKEITAINNVLPEDRKLSLQERREIISKKIYPKYQGKPKSKVKLTELRNSLINAVKKVPLKPGCDVLAIDPVSYNEIAYFDAENFIVTVLPNCIFIRINAGQYGSTNIFNTRGFDYYKSGLSNITNAINSSTGTDRKSSDVPVYSGFVKTRPRKKNDGKPDNYFLDLVLSIVDDPEATIPAKFLHKKKTKKELRAESNVKKYVRDRLKAFKNEKSKFKQIRTTIATYTNRLASTATGPFDLKYKRNDMKEVREGFLTKLKKFKDAGKITEARYKKEITKFEKIYQTRFASLTRKKK